MCVEGGDKDRLHICVCHGETYVRRRYVVKCVYVCKMVLQFTETEIRKTESVSYRDVNDSNVFDDVWDWDV